MFVSGSAMLLADTAIGAGTRSETWPSWQRFKLLYLSSEGRVVDASTERHITTSQSQAYAMFFALVANDRAVFDELLDWTRQELAAGEFARTLPACKWGRDDDCAWGVLDEQSRSNADLWIAYSLGEAARLWHDSAYLHLAAGVARNILRQEVARIPGLGAALLPGPKGFADDHRWRFNPGYLALPAIRGIARQSKDTLWSEIAQSSERIIHGCAADGFAADWAEFTPTEGFVARPKQSPHSHDAMLVYLWAGMLPASDPARDQLATALQPMLNSLTRAEAPGDTPDAQEFALHSVGAPGSSAALLPMLANARMPIALQVHRKRAAEHSLQDNQHCDSDLLALFGLGWLEQRYRFNAAGVLSVRWTPPGSRPH